jgi:hypothetical protein
MLNHRHSIEHKQASATFHQWADSQHMYGLNFASLKDAEVRSTSSRLFDETRRREEVELHNQLSRVCAGVFANIRRRVEYAREATRSTRERFDLSFFLSVFVRLKSV